MRLPIVIALALSLTPACAERDPTPDAPATEAPSPSKPPAAEVERLEQPAPSTPRAFDTLPLTARLPADAAGIIAIASPADLARRLGWSALLEALGPMVALGDPGAADGPGALDPATWGAAGIDASGPAGIALLQVDPPIIAVVATVKDREAVRATLQRLTPDNVEVKQATEGELLLLYTNDAAMGLRPDEGWLVIGEQLEPGEALHHARALAQRPAATLLERSTVGSAVARLDGGRDVAAIVNLPAIFDEVLRRAMGTTEVLDRRVRGAKALGDQEAVTALNAQLLRARARGLEGRAAELGMTMVVRGLLTPFGGLALGLNLDQRAVELRFAHHLDRGSPVGQILASRDGPLVLGAAFPRAPAGLVELAVDPAALWGLARTASTTTGANRDLARLDRTLTEHTGRDIAGLVALLSGQVGGAAEIDPARVVGARRPDELIAQARFAAYLGLADAPGAVTALDRLAARHDGGLIKLDSSKGGAPRWRLGLGHRDTLWLGVAGARLLASLDEQTLERLLGQSGAAPGAGFTAGLNPELQATLDRRDGAWIGWLDIAGLAPLMMDSRPTMNRDVPDGEGQAAKLRYRIAMIDRQIDAHHRARRAEQIKRGRALLATLGHAAGRIEPVAEGVGGQAVLSLGAPSLDAATLAVARELRAADEGFTAFWQETIEPLYEEQRALRSELRALESRAPKP